MELLPDVNVLLALAGVDDIRRPASVRAVEAATSWATCPITEASFIRLAMNRSVPGGGLTAAQALAVLRGLRAHPRWRFLTDDCSPAESRIDTAAITGFQQVTDFHLVDLAARHGVWFATFDAKLPRSLAPADRGHVHVLSV